MKKQLRIFRADKSDIAPLLQQHHYLAQISKGFRSGYNYALAHGEIMTQIVGAAVFTNIPAAELCEGMFGISRKEQNGLFELSRLCLAPDIQKTEHNLASWFLARAIRLLRKDTDVRAVLSYADSDYHRGIVYAASGFDYYGMTDSKKDFYFFTEDGRVVKHSRGKTRGAKGEWRPRSQKHRFLKVFDKSLPPVKWQRQKWTAN